MRLPLFIILSLGALGCATTSTYNVIDITDNQWLEDKDGNLCVEKEMIINVDNITFFYENCLVRRVVKPKPHILPKPSPSCDNLQCSP